MDSTKIKARHRFDPASKSVLLPQPIETEAVTMLEKAGCKLILSPERNFETVAPLMGKAEGLILRTGIRITRELLAHADRLEIISRTGGGFDNVDVAAATEKGIIVTSNIGINTTSVVEHCLSMMFSLAKQLPALDRAVRKDQYTIRYQNLPQDLQNKTLGLVGFGRIGSRLGKICRQIFDMEILVYDPFLPEAVKSDCCDWVEFVDLHALFSKSDVISVHVPLTESTHHAVGQKELALMKPTALLINTSRGPVVDEPALVNALRQKRIGGAGLDVLEQEPPSADHPMLGLDNVILTPHTAALTSDCVIRMATTAAACVLDVFNGKEPPNVANPETLKTDRWTHLASRK
jgi:D-3-phosphoglycerate dehydrogenase / 2-oxoglutarate reductase